MLLEVLACVQRGNSTIMALVRTALEPIAPLVVVALPAVQNAMPDMLLRVTPAQTSVLHLAPLVELVLPAAILASLRMF